jgi:hypothetical protein
MRHILSLVILLAASSVQADAKVLHGTVDIFRRVPGNPPPAEVKHWVEFRWGGTQSLPVPVIFFTTQPFAAAGSENVDVVSKAEFSRIDKFSRAYPCLTKEENAHFLEKARKGEAEDYVFMLGGASAGETRFGCRIMRPSGCRYMTQLAHLEGVKLDAEMVNLLASLKDEFKCDGTGKFQHP